MRNIVLFFAINCLFLNPVFGEESLTSFDLPAKNSQKAFIQSLVINERSGTPQILKLEELKVKIDITGFLAKTRVAMTFHNTTKRRQEGTLRYQIPLGAAIDRLAMNVGTRLVEGEVVERKRAAQIYRTIVNQVMDPALMEWENGQTFKTRIFPIFPNEHKTIIVEYSQELVRKQGRFYYSLPLAQDKLAEGPLNFLSVTVQGVDKLKDLKSNLSDVFKLDNDKLTFKKKNYISEKNLHLNFASSHQVAALKSPSSATENATNENFYAISTLPEVTWPEAVISSEKYLVILDTSGSQTPFEWTLSKYFLSSICNRIKPGKKLMVVGFDIQVNEVTKGFEKYSNYLRERIHKQMENEIPMGGSNLQKLALYLKKQDLSDTMVILLSDCTPSVGEDRNKQLGELFESLKTKGLRCNTVSVGKDTNNELLNIISDRLTGSKGKLEAGQDVQRKATRILDDFFGTGRIRDLEIVKGVPGLEDILPRRISCTSRGEAVSLIGKTTSDFKGGTLELQGYLCGKKVTVSIDLPTPQGFSPMLKKTWSRRKVQQMLEMPQSEIQRSEIVTFATEHKLLTPYTSLLVLEGESEYKKYNVNRDKETEQARLDKLNKALVRQMQKAVTDIQKLTGRGRTEELIKKRQELIDILRDLDADLTGGRMEVLKQIGADLSTAPPEAKKRKPTSSPLEQIASKCGNQEKKQTKTSGKETGTSKANKRYQDTVKRMNNTPPAARPSEKTGASDAAKRLGLYSQPTGSNNNSGFDEEEDGETDEEERVTDKRLENIFGTGWRHALREVKTTGTTLPQAFKAWTDAGFAKEEFIVCLAIAKEDKKQFQKLVAVLSQYPCPDWCYFWTADIARDKFKEERLAKRLESQPVEKEPKEITTKKLFINYLLDRRRFSEALIESAKSVRLELDTQALKVLLESSGGAANWETSVDIYKGIIEKQGNLEIGKVAKSCLQELALRKRVEVSRYNATKAQRTEFYRIVENLKLKEQFVNDLKIIVEWKGADALIEMQVKEPRGGCVKNEKRTSKTGGKMEEQHWGETIRREVYTAPSDLYGKYRPKLRLSPSGKQVTAKVTIIRNEGKPGETIFRYRLHLTKPKKWTTVKPVELKKKKQK